MTKIDTSKIKPGDEVQIANGDWYEARYVGGMLKAAGVLVSTLVSNNLITGHRPAKTEVQEWVTYREVCYVWTYNTTSEAMDYLNALLTRKYGQPPKGGAK